MNSDHTHFIIIREQPIGSSLLNSPGRKVLVSENTEKPLEKLTDSDDSATNRFRDRFDDFLHQETLQQQAPTEPTAAVTTGRISLSNVDRSFLPLLDGGDALALKRQNPWSEDGFPMVCTLVRGTPGTIELLHRKIQQEVPAVILKGTGSAADIISFAYEEISAK